MGCDVSKITKKSLLTFENCHLTNCRKTKGYFTRHQVETNVSHREGCTI